MKDKGKVEFNNDPGMASISFCPGCGSDNIWRIMRTETEKVVCYLSGGNYIIKKYVCQSCQQNTLLHNSGAVVGSHFKVEDNLITGFLPCARCGLANAQLNSVPLGEENSYHTQTGNTAFKKLVCIDCNNETIIGKEDFDAFNKQEF